MKIKLKYNKFQIAMEIIAVLLLVGMAAYLLIRWGDVPDKIPGHYSATGEIDRWGDKSELWNMPIAGAGLYLILTVIGFFPAVWNVPVRVTAENQDKVYGYTKSMMLLMKVEALICFSYLNYNSIETQPLTIYFLPIAVAFVIATFLYFLLKIRKAAK